ncbi:MAG: ArnT family glycosyltransferase, partial [Anaerolineales bacterium]
MNKRAFLQQFFSSDTMLLISIAALKLLLHFSTNNQLLGYGYFRDEFYYLIGAKRLDFGYVDHPPFAMLLLSLKRWLLGDSIFALRLLPAIAGTATVFLTGLMARQLGGGKLAQSLAALSVVVSPAYLVINGFYSPNAFELLWWTLCAYLLILLLKHDR